ncbi:DUF6875 domain-containing protein [Nocardia camponoti]|uniref:DUF6875 domain-containing protein n=1 Tax=Nocardia camponoti TaxID=1616106 RepID=A0A917QEV7_9NOCA|nr:hypothetical protein [Nocardia camponoti]GGK45703.1 hypothetical protein GCM10011591_16500 [Nocardia camponoti]
MRTWTGPTTNATWSCVYDDPARWIVDHPHASAVVAWFADSLMRPDPQQGRPGPVCPFMKPAAAQHRIWIAEVEDASHKLANTIDDAFTLYRSLPTDRPPTVVTVFPDLTDTAEIDQAHAEAKDHIVAQGAMLGQFYPGCPVAGLFNADFRPLNAPTPMLVIRPMMNTDFPFLVGRREWLVAYLAKHAPGLPRKLRGQIAERMHVAEPSPDAIPELRAHFADEHAQ